MNDLTHKYSRQIGSSILASYLLIFILSVFHFHHFELITSPVFADANQNNTASQISVNESGCIVLQNFNSLHSLTIPKNVSAFIFIPICSPCALRSGISDIINPHLSQLKLRAPPTFS